MNRRTLFVAALSICLVALLSGCSVKRESSAQQEGSVTTLAAGTIQPERGAKSAATGQTNEAQAMSRYLDTMTLVATLDFAETLAQQERAVFGLMNDAWAMGRYQDTDFLYSILETEKLITQPNDAGVIDGGYMDTITLVHTMDSLNIPSK